MVVLSRAGVGSVTRTHVALLEARAEIEFVVRERAPDPEEAVRILRRATVLATTNVTLPHLDDRVLGRLPHLHSVVLYATGHEHVPLAALARHGVTLTTLPHYATRAVAEHALGLLLSLSTRTHLANDRARGRVPATTSLRGVELGGRTLGVIGVGRIGRRLAGIAAGIGMKVIGCDPDPAARAAAEARGVEMTSLDDLLHRAQAVAVCASTDPAAPLILDPARIERMRPGALLVNVGRPGLVDTAAVLAAVRSEDLRGYAVDDVVLDPTADADVLSEGRVVQTAHSAWWRDEVLARGAEHFGQAILAAVQREPVDLVVEGAAVEAAASGGAAGRSVTADAGEGQVA